MRLRRGSTHTIPFNRWDVFEDGHLYNNAKHLSSRRPVAVVILFLLSPVLCGIQVISIIIDLMQSDFIRICNYLVENVNISDLFLFNKHNFLRYYFKGITSTSLNRYLT